MTHPSPSATYIVLCAQIVGSGPFVSVYGFDGQRFASRERAIEHGFTKGRSDDFNIGVLEGDKLIRLDWMRQLVDDDPAVLREIADQVGLEAS